MTITETKEMGAKEKLCSWLKPGDKVYTILKHVSQSGMTREISVVYVDGNEIITLNYWVSEITGRKTGKHGGIISQGCGMDMGFELVYYLSKLLFNDGYALKTSWL